MSSPIKKIIDRVRPNADQVPIHKCLRSNMARKPLLHQTQVQLNDHQPTVSMVPAVAAHQVAREALDAVSKQNLKEYGEYKYE